MIDVFDKMMDFKTNGVDCVLVTAIDKQGDGPIEVGKKMVVSSSGEFFGTVGGGFLEHNAIEYCKEVLKNKLSETKKYLLNEGTLIENTTTLPMHCGGVVSFFYEYIGIKDYIYIFGGGHVSQALVNVLKTMEFHVTVIDDRKDIIERFEGANVKVHTPFLSYVEEVGIKDGSYVVITTPSHTHDYEIVKKILKLKLNPKYYGMICSTRKLTVLLEDIYATFGKDVNLSNFYAPIGLNLGGGSPAEIAISISGEILSIVNKKEEVKNMRNKLENTKHNYWIK